MRESQHSSPVVVPAARIIAASGEFAAAQAEFAHALLDADAAVPPGLIGPEGTPSARRFSVYRNNVIVGLIEALKAAYPVVRRLVGDAFFVAMARTHATQEPPVSPIMLDYGAGFPDFIAGFEPAATLPYLADVARLERTWVEAYHAAEAIPLTRSAVARLARDHLPSCRLILHPAVRILRSDYPIIEIWRTNLDGSGTEAISLDQAGDDVLISRPAAEVEIRRMPAGAAAFIRAVQAGKPVVDAMRQGIADNTQFDLANTLIGLIEADTIIDITKDHAPYLPNGREAP
jgi:hypothetical protein